MRDAELHDVLERLADRVEPSPDLLNDIRVAIRVAERRRRIRVVAVVIGLLVLMTAAVLVLSYVRSVGSAPDGTRPTSERSVDTGPPRVPTRSDAPSGDSLTETGAFCTAAFGVMRGLDVGPSTTSADVADWVSDQRVLVEALASPLDAEVAPDAATFGRRYTAVLDQLETSGFDPALAGRLGEELAADPEAFGLTPAEYDEAENAYDAIVRVWALSNCDRTTEERTP